VVIRADSAVVPRVSVIIATYNWAPVLPYSIASVLDQTFTDFEVLVVGDGCTDESAAVVASFQDPRVQWINLARRAGHQTGPNNEGQRRARGDIVAYLGHDDLWLPQHLELLVGAIDAGAPAAHASVLLVLPQRPPVVLPPDGWTYSRGTTILPQSMALARAVLVAVGGWRMPRESGFLTPEMDLWARVFDVAGPPVWEPQVTSVKLPAAFRRDVYRSRPHLEQEHWLRTIREAPDPQVALLATVGAPYVSAQEYPRARLRTRVKQALTNRLRERLGIPFGVAVRPRILRPRAATSIRRAQRFKGL
jgi:glycosyltransferase involved in cell wall biosynthesis